MWWTDDTMKDVMEKVDKWLQSKGDSIDIVSTNLSSLAWVATFSGSDPAAESKRSNQFVIVFRKR